MNSDSGKQNESGKTKKRSHWAISCDAEVHKKIKRLVQRANKKDSGRRISANAILSVALDLVTDEQIKDLQEGAMTSEERLEKMRSSYIKTHGMITHDDFLRILIDAANLTNENRSG